MTAFHVLQLALAAVAVLLIASRLSSSLRNGALDVRPFESALREALRAGRAERALSLADALRPAAAAVLASDVLAERARGGDERFVLEDVHAQLRRLTVRGRDEIVALGRMASPLALIGVIIELAPTGLLGSKAVAGERGAVFGHALSHGVLGFAIGIATLALCWSAAHLIQRRGAGIARDLDRIAALFDGPVHESESGAM